MAAKGPPKRPFLANRRRTRSPFDASSEEAGGLDPAQPEDDDARAQGHGNQADSPANQGGGACRFDGGGGLHPVPGLGGGARGCCRGCGRHGAGPGRAAGGGRRRARRTAGGGAAGGGWVGARAGGGVARGVLCWRLARRRGLLAAGRLAGYRLRRRRRGFGRNRLWRGSGGRGRRNGGPPGSALIRALRGCGRRRRRRGSALSWPGSGGAGRRRGRRRAQEAAEHPVDADRNGGRRRVRAGRRRRSVSGRNPCRECQYRSYRCRCRAAPESPMVTGRRF